MAGKKYVAALLPVSDRGPLPDGAGKGLSPQQVTFVRAYLLRGRDCVAAAEAAGYPQPDLVGPHLIRVTAVKRAITVLYAEHCARLAHHALERLEKIVTNDNPLDAKQEANQVRAAQILIQHAEFRTKMSEAYENEDEQAQKDTERLSMRELQRIVDDWRKGTAIEVEGSVTDGIVETDAT